jgi:hypothetical protein
MPEIVWSQAVEGEQPDCILGEDRILMHYTALGEEKDTELVCFDVEGRKLWSRRGWRVLLSLSGDGFLLNTPEGRPVIVDGDGDIRGRWAGGGIERVTRHDNLLLLASKQQVDAADLDLSRLWQMNWTGSPLPPIDCLVDGFLFWVEDNRLKMVGRNGRPETICRLPEDLIREAMEQHEQTTGSPALSGWSVSLDDPAAEFKPFFMGDRPTFFYWWVSFDRVEGWFFLANSMAPHLIACLDHSGQPRWCKYLSFGCCGGLPYSLPNGLYVASSGCGGILSWFDSDGNILFQSEPHEGVGLATAYSNEVQVLPAGSCLAHGGPGIVAYTSTGEQRWLFKHSYSKFHCNPAKEILVGCYWRRGEDGLPSQTILEVAHGL